MSKNTAQRIDLQKELIARCCSNDKRAQLSLYNQYSKAMFNVCLNLVHDRQQAEELMQDAFISAFRNIEGYKGEVAFGAWLKRITINKCLDYLKKRRIEFEPLDDYPNIRDLEDNNDEIFRQQTIECIRKAISELPEGYRTIISLLLFEGFDHEEISQILGITESTSRSQYTRAKVALVNILKKNEHGQLTENI